MQRIVISENMDAPAVALLARDFDVDYRPALVDDVAALARALAGADAWIVRNRTQVRGAALETASALRVVGRLGVGLDNIDLAECTARGIEVIPATGANAESVAEYVLGMSMILLRGAAYLSTAAVAAGRWPRQMLSQGHEVSGKTMGLVGFGSIGRVTARKAGALGIRVVAFDPGVPADSPAWAETGATPCAFEDLLARADVVSLHVPFAEATYRLFDEARIGRMKPGAILVNSARGGIVDEAALAKALHEGRLAGAALDVFEAEPLGAGSVLAGVPNLILTPHISGVTLESNERVCILIAQRVAKFLNS
ncbi:MAG: hydroxyacid dehydrogenase [Betaproteobacteria bacterium]|nr:hydroxyacid dehydrogenase [Betaproteobacteria bacterium]